MGLVELLVEHSCILDKGNTPLHTLPVLDQCLATIRNSGPNFSFLLCPSGPGGVLVAPGLEVSTGQQLAFPTIVCLLQW